MKRMWALALAALLVLSLAACDANDEKLSAGTVKLQAADGQETADKERVPGCPVGWEDRVRDFSLRLFREAYAMQNDENAAETAAGAANRAAQGDFVIAPASVLTALLMAEEGADGETAAQVQETVGVEVLYAREAFEKILNAKGDGTQLHTTNSVWFRKDEDRLQVQPNFPAAMQQLFDAEVFRADFDEKTRKDINQWCKNNTRGRI